MSAEGSVGPVGSALMAVKVVVAVAGLVRHSSASAEHQCLFC